MSARLAPNRIFMLTPNWTWPAICMSLKDLRSEGIGSLAPGDLAEPRRSLDDKSILNHWEETMKIRSVVTIVGLAISFGLPTSAQQTNTPDPQLRQKLVEVIAKHADALNKNDAAAAAACFTQEGVYVTDRGPVNGREAIEKWYADLFKVLKNSGDHVSAIDQDSPHVIGTAGNEIWATGGWSSTIKGESFGPLQIKGYWSVIRVGDDWKMRMLSFNATPAN